MRGRLILDRATSELRSLEFSYDGLPRDVKEGDAGGRVRFTRVPDGTWIVSQWALRIPTMEIEGTMENLDRARATIHQVRETAGEVLEVTRGSDIVHEGRRRSIGGRLVDSSGVGPARGRVGLVGTLTEGEVGADGVFRFEDVVPGRYRLTASSAALDSLGLPTDLGTIDVRDSSAVGLMLRLPTPDSVYRAACKREDEHAANATGLLRGVVRDAGGIAVPNATVRVLFVRADTIGTRIIPRPGRRLMIEAASDGSFRYCRVPRGSRLRIAAMDGERAGTEVEAVLPRGKAFLVVDLLAPRQVQ
ncbi:MAG: carboxypeptidase regulatory-like domain-containing protein [Cytophagaceae bacterium]|nr:carboxypeptidase regulatory-like domain-containing protein [Gemmatimonadaceae bacterium]